MRRSTLSPAPAPQAPLDTPPPAATLVKANSYKLFNSKNERIRFGDIFSPNPTSRVLVLFIRHFFCGNCQEYIRRITALIPPTSLPKDLSIAIIGCGAPSLIPSYVDLTSCPYPIYSDPSAKLFEMLGMHRSLSLGPRAPEYIQHSLLAGCIKSVVQGLKRIGSGDVMSAGDLSVNGGEFIFDRGLDQKWSVSWCHRMQNSRDHSEVDDLMGTLGLQQPEAPKPQSRPLVRRATTSKLQRSLSQRRQDLVSGLRRASSMRKSSRSPSRKESPVRREPKLKTISDEGTGTVIHLIEV